MDEKRKVTQEELDNACLLHNKRMCSICRKLPARSTSRSGCITYIIPRFLAQSTDLVFDNVIIR